MINKCITFLLLMCLLIPSVSAEIVNGFFDTDIDGWTTDLGDGNGTIEWDDEFGVGGTGYCHMTLPLLSGDNENTISVSQNVDVTGYNKIGFYLKKQVGLIPDHVGGDINAYIGSNDLNIEYVTQDYAHYIMNVTGSGYQEFSVELYFWNTPGYPSSTTLWLDNVELLDQYLFTLSGYIENTEGSPVRTYPYLNNSDSTESNDTTGYYEFTGLTEGSYLLSIDGFVYDDYSAVIDISADTEHNITLSRQLPILSTTNINPGKNKMLLTWTRNVVVSDILIYRGTNTNQIASVSSGAYLTGYYQDENLDCESPYTYWLQPKDNDILGPKYELSDITTDCEAPDVFIPLPPVIPTPPIYEEDANETIIGEIIEIITELLPEPLKELPEKVLEIIEETITYVSTPFNWLLLITAYIGAFIGKSIFNNDEDHAEIITSTLLLGTIGWIVVLLINFVVPIISQNEVISILIFTTSGFIIAAIASSIQPETKTRAPRRPHT